MRDRAAHHKIVSGRVRRRVRRLLEAAHQRLAGDVGVARRKLGCGCAVASADGHPDRLMFVPDALAAAAVHQHGAHHATQVDPVQQGTAAMYGLLLAS